MKLTADKKIRNLLLKSVLAIAVFTVIQCAVLLFFPDYSMFLVPVLSIIMGVATVFSIYSYLNEQNRIMEDAISDIRKYISGNRNVRIDSNYEGSIYVMFHEINTLVSTLNAHAENEKYTKKFLKDTISDISHQLKTPIAALNIYNGIIEGEAENLPEIQNFTALSEQELDRIETLVQNLLKITKLDAGTIEMDFKEENLGNIMSAIKKHFYYRAELENKNFIFSGDESLNINCDRNWFIEAVSNLVKNAFDHTDSGCSINVSWRKLPTVIQITVKDDGSGIHEEDIYHIFKRFYRSRFSKDTQGVGLGLPLTKYIVEAHNGTIEVKSQLGVGTEFVINIPITTKL